MPSCSWIDAAGINLDSVDKCRFFERLLETYLANVPHGFRSFRLDATVGKGKAVPEAEPREGAGRVHRRR